MNTEKLSIIGLLLLVLLGLAGFGLYLASDTNSSQDYPTPPDQEIAALEGLVAEAQRATARAEAVVASKDLELAEARAELTDVSTKAEQSANRESARQEELTAFRSKVDAQSAKVAQLSREIASCEELRSKAAVALKDARSNLAKAMKVVRIQKQRMGEQADQIKALKKPRPTPVAPPSGS